MNQAERCTAVITDNNHVEYRCRRVKDHALTPEPNFDRDGLIAPILGRQFHISDPLEHDDGQTCTIMRWDATVDSMGRE